MDKRVDPIRGESDLKKEGLEKRGTVVPSSSLPLNFETFRESQLFHTEERATLTFFSGQEVASIHYDRGRNEIFYKGHNVKNMTLTPEHWQFLQKFIKYLEKEEADEGLRRDYEACLSKILPPR